MVFHSFCSVINILLIKAQRTEWGKQKKVHCDSICLPKHTEPCFTGRDWTSACWWKVVDELFLFFCFCTKLLLSCQTITNSIMFLLCFHFLTTFQETRLSEKQNKSLATHCGQPKWVALEPSFFHHMHLLPPKPSFIWKQEG